MVRQENEQTSYFAEQDCVLDDFAALVSQKMPQHAAAHAVSTDKNIPIYDAQALSSVFESSEGRRALMAEWAQILRNEAGVLVIKNAYADTSVIDEATVIYDQIIGREKLAGGGADHFAKAGSNDRIWNSLQKLCEASPEVFARYFSNVAIDAVCEAWLGPNYQMTAQINLVHPGGAAQQAHRDYHLGFQTAAVSATYPAHVHDLSPALTLQGAVAHCDMPLESGPTKLLPFSQLYRPGYAAWRRSDFRDYFQDHCVQLPLSKGDAVFFNPALFHAAGTNTSADILRMANLLQVSSAFGRAMETVDRETMSKRLFPTLAKFKANETLSASEIRVAIACCAEGYSFPTNLDRDPPVNGLAPETQQELFLRALDSNMSELEFASAVEVQSDRRCS